MPQFANPATLDDALLEFPKAFRKNGCFSSPNNDDEQFLVSEGTLPLDRISFWKINCHEKSTAPFPILGISASTSGGGGEADSYRDPSFFGWRSDASSWQGGKVVREGQEWVGFRSNQQLVFRYDPVSSQKTHFLSVQVIDTDIEATMLVPAPVCKEEYRISMTLNEGAQVTISTASTVDVRYWEIEQEILAANNEIISSTRK
jgi:hypothetical protein